MEKGKSYLVLLKKKKQNLIREVECLEETKTCYKIGFKSELHNSFNLEMFNEKIQWILKNEFESKFQLLEELPENYGHYKQPNIIRVEPPPSR